LFSIEHEGPRQVVLLDLTSGQSLVIGEGASAHFGANQSETLFRRNGQIMTSAIDGLDPTVVIDEALLMEFDVSLDAASVVYTRLAENGDSDGAAEVMTAPVSTGEERRLLAADGWQYPQWSPDGQLLALQRSDCPITQDCVAELWVASPQEPVERWPLADPQSECLLPLSGPLALIGDPGDKGRCNPSGPIEWSPDGFQLAYVSNSAAIVVGSADGSGSALLWEDPSQNALIRSLTWQAR
jgi:hypothetical protein